MTHDDVQRWLDAYVAAWQTYDPEAIGALFATDATYRYHPYDTEAVVGRDAIVADWLDSPDAAGTWTAHYMPWVVEGDRAVAVGESRYVKADGTFRDLYFNAWLLRFDADGRCSEFVEYYMALPDHLKAAQT